MDQTNCIAFCYEIYSDVLVMVVMTEIITTMKSRFNLHQNLNTTVFAY